MIGAILTGQTKTMFSFSTGRQHFELAPSIGVGIKDLFGVFLSAGIIFDANLTMGYDTAGLIAVVQDAAPQSSESAAWLLFRQQHRLYRAADSEPRAGPANRVVPAGVHGAFRSPPCDDHYRRDIRQRRRRIGQHRRLADTCTSIRCIDNLAGSGKVFHLAARSYASADISLTLPTPIPAQISRCFSYNLAL